MEDAGHRQQDLYWTKMVELRVAAEYVRLYRDSLNKWVTGVALFRAIASSASIAAWAIWRQYAFAWALIIAVSQVLDALSNVFPIFKRHKAASEHSIVLEGLFIDAQLEWENIFAGKYTDEQISKRLHNLRMLHHRAAFKSFEDGLPVKPGIFKKAEHEATTFFRKSYGVDFEYGDRYGRLE